MSHRGRRKKRISGGFVAAVLLSLSLLTGAAALFLVFRVVQHTHETTVEAGEMPDMDALAYFSGTDAALSYMLLTQGVEDVSRVGEEKLVYSYLHFFEYQVTVHIVDTTPPEFELTQKELGLAPGDILDVSSLVTDLKDNSSGAVTVSFADGSKTQSFDTYGCFYDMVCALDENGNVSREPLTIWVADAPEITVPRVYYVMQSEEGYGEEEFLRSVTVTDNQDGDAIRDCLTMTWGEFDSGKAGDYEVEFSADNSYHVSASVRVMVHVIPEEKMTSALMADVDALFDGEVLTKDTGAELARQGKEDILTAEELVQPTLVSIYYKLKNGYAYGNGFVIDLTRDAVYIASNYHVLAPFENETAQITFYPGYYTSRYTFLGGNEEKDVAFLKIDKSALPDEVADYLREPKISLARALTISGGEPLFRESLFVNKPNHTEEGVFSAYESEIFNGDKYTTFTVQIEQGDSGSAIYDAHGYLISMCAGVSHEENMDQMCGVQLEWILSEYERCSGNKVYGF